MAKERASDWAIVESDSFEVSAGRRSAELPSTPEIKRYVAECREFLQAGTVPERKELIRNFVKGIKIDGIRCRFGTLSPSPPTAPDRKKNRSPFVRLGLSSQHSGMVGSCFCIASLWLRLCRRDSFWHEIPYEAILPTLRLAMAANPLGSPRVSADARGHCVSRCSARPLLRQARRPVAARLINIRVDVHLRIRLADGAALRL